MRNEKISFDRSNKNSYSDEQPPIKKADKKNYFVHLRENFFNFGTQLCEVIVSVSNFFIFTAALNHFANIMKVDNFIILELDLPNFFAFPKPKKLFIIRHSFLICPSISENCFLSALPHKRTNGVSKHLKLARVAKFMASLVTTYHSTD